MDDTHMRHSFEEDIRELEQELLSMGGVVEDMLSKAVQALVNRDRLLADEAIAMDDIADSYNVNIETRCLRLLALQQPMARDLRTIAAAMKIITDIERMGDYAVDIAKTARFLADQTPYKPLVDIPEMAEIVQRMLREVLEAFVSRDLGLVEKMVSDDDVVDKMAHDLHEELADAIERNPTITRQALRLLLITRYLERIADHITNVGERVYYMETGELKELHL